MQKYSSIRSAESQSGSTERFDEDVAEMDVGGEVAQTLVCDFTSWRKTQT